MYLQGVGYIFTTVPMYQSVNGVYADATYLLIQIIYESHIRHICGFAQFRSLDDFPFFEFIRIHCHY